MYEDQLYPAGIAVSHRDTHDLRDPSRVVVVIHHLQPKQHTWNTTGHCGNHPLQDCTQGILQQAALPDMNTLSCVYEQCAEVAWHVKTGDSGPTVQYASFWGHGNDIFIFNLKIKNLNHPLNNKLFVLPLDK